MPQTRPPPSCHFTPPPPTPAQDINQFVLEAGPAIANSESSVRRVVSTTTARLDVRARSWLAALVVTRRSSLQALSARVSNLDCDRSISVSNSFLRQVCSPCVATRARASRCAQLCSWPRRRRRGCAAARRSQHGAVSQPSDAPRAPIKKRGADERHARRAVQMRAATRGCNEEYVCFYSAQKKVDYLFSRRSCWSLRTCSEMRRRARQRASRET